MKKMINKILWITVIAALTLSFVGCGDRNVDQPDGNEVDNSGYTDPVEGEQPDNNDQQSGSQQGNTQPPDSGNTDPRPDGPSTQEPDTDEPYQPSDGGSSDNEPDTQPDDEPDDEPSGGGQSGNQSGNQGSENDQPTVTQKYPWETGGKAPSEYTWDEFLALSTEYKEAFIASFRNAQAYMNWLEKANDAIQPKSDLPWENGGKQPSEYTLDEFLALTDEQKAAFVATFAQPSDYAAWLAGSQGGSGTNTDPKPVDPEPTPSTPTEKMPWELPGGKRPADYTWAEYNALTPAQKAAFFKTFSNEYDFNVWMNNALGLGNSGSGSGSGSGSTTPEVIPPWTTGGKQPVQYTWEEYEALPAALKEAFRNSFKTQEEYDAWYQKVQGSAPLMPWEDGGKLPNQYTWAEFQALSDDVQEAFYEWFGSNEAFDAWRLSVTGNGGSSNTPTLPWENGGKAPNQYTWAEFQALSYELQEYFQDWFGSSEAFMDWLNTVNGSGNTPALPWENGGKAPSQYTWAEFQALSDELKEYFQDWFANYEAFEAWMNSVNGNGGGNDAPLIPWENGGKLPTQYTWAEFLALDDVLQEYFQDWFIENNLSFGDWYDSVQS